MGKFPRVTKLLLATVILASAVLSSARQTGGSYTLSLDGTTSFPISSIDFGETNGVDSSTGSSTGKTNLSPVTITASAATSQLYGLFAACISGQRYTTISATYFDAGGHAQFTVTFKPAIVSSYTFPAVDKTNSPLGDITFQLSVGAEQYTTPSNSTTNGVTRISNANRTAGGTVIISRVWRSVVQPLPPAAGKFSLTIPAVNTSGVQTIQSITAKNAVSSSGLGSGKASITQFSVTVTAAMAGDFIAKSQNHTVVPTVTLVLNRNNASGGNLPLTLTFKNVLFSGYNLAGNPPIATVNFTAASVETEVSGLHNVINVGTLLKAF
jgi:hypothetical protein